MATAKKHYKINGILGIACIFFIMVCFMALLIPNQEAYAESKKVSGTVKASRDLGRNHIRSTAFKPAIPVGEMTNIFGIYSSDDPDWNNATFFAVWLIENLNFVGYAGVTHPGGDQTFRAVKGKLKALNVHDWTSQYRGWFTGGTGKFEGINGTWKAKTVQTQSESTTEWEAEYEIK